MQEDITDVKHRLHARAVLFDVSLQVLRLEQSKEYLEVLLVVVTVGRLASEALHSPTLLAAQVHGHLRSATRTVSLSSLCNPCAVAPDTNWPQLGFVC